MFSSNLVYRFLGSTNHMIPRPLIVIVFEGGASSGRMFDVTTFGVCELHVGTNGSPCIRAPIKAFAVDEVLAESAMKLLSIAVVEVTVAGRGLESTKVR